MPKVAFREIRSRGLHPNWPRIGDEAKATMERKSKPELIAAHERIVADWRNQPEFRARKTVSAKGFTVFVYASGDNADIWGFVTGGTRPHTIRPRGPGYPLRFQWGGPGSYKPKTNVMGQYKGPGKVVGGKEVRFMSVRHPGNAPRNFEKIIAQAYKPIFARDMENAFRRGIRRAKREGRPR